ncbi:MAG: protease SohB, partial [Pseudomonadota bacterium]
KPRAFVIDFEGDVQASGTDALTKKVNSVLSVSDANDEVIVRVESPGGVVHGYGLAASQLKRITDNELKLTVCVDKVAASGGYMMACVADNIIAAPFAIIGSIGVVASLPNFNKLLKKHDIDYDIYTAGEYKRTVTMLGENTEEGKKKLNEDLLQTHELFKNMISANRPELDIASVATGEIWYGQQAIDKGLVDAVGTSDAHLMKLLPTHDIFMIDYKKKETLTERLGLSISAAMERSVSNILNRASNITLS